MYTPITDLDLSKQAPHSPRDRNAGFVIANRAIDKCRATIAGTPGEYHFDCPVDNMLFSFKGITGEQFKAAVQHAKTYEEVGAWLTKNGTPKTLEEINAWSNEMAAASLVNDPEKHDYFVDACTKLGLDPKTSTIFDWLEADDRASFNDTAVPHGFSRST